MTWCDVILILVSRGTGGGQRETFDGRRSEEFGAGQRAGGEPATQDGFEPGDYKCGDTSYEYEFCQLPRYAPWERGSSIRSITRSSCTLHIFFCFWLLPSYLVRFLFSPSSSLHVTQIQGH